MTDAHDETGWQRLDWDSVIQEPMVAGGFMVIVRGVSPVPMDVEFHDMPIGVVPEDYQGVLVRGRAKNPTIEVEQPWTLERSMDEFARGTVGFVLVGATKREFIPPKDK